jgi:hypothetical protein
MNLFVVAVAPSRCNPHARCILRRPNHLVNKCLNSTDAPVDTLKIFWGCAPIYGEDETARVNSDEFREANRLRGGVGGEGGTGSAGAAAIREEG